MLMLEDVQEQAVERVSRFTSSELNCGSAFYAGARVALRGAKRVEPPIQRRAWQTRPEMSPSQQPARINLQDLKAQIVKRIGPDKANQYFSYFKGYMSLKLKKPELDKLVVLTIGKENISLHNQLVRAVLHNAIRSDVPPPSPLGQDTSKPVKGIRRKPFSQSISCDDSVAHIPVSPVPSVWSNGEAFIMSPKKERSGLRDRKASKDRPSPLGPPGRRESSSQLVSSGGVAAGDGGPIDMYRPVQKIQGAAEQLEADPNVGHLRSGKRPRTIGSFEHPDIDNSQGGAKLYSGDANEREIMEAPSQFREGGSIRAPLGLPFCPGSIGSARKPPCVGLPAPLAQILLHEGMEMELLDGGYLPDLETLLSRMGRIATAEGLEGVSRDCIGIINQGLDIYLKRLIEPCVGLVRSKSAPQRESQALKKDQQESHALKKDPGPTRKIDSMREGHLSASKLNECVKGVWSDHNMQEHGLGAGGEITQKEGSLMHPTVSLQDFKVAMELKPQHLGDDWPTQLEKISFRCFD